MICLAIAPLLARSQYSCSDFGDESACTLNTSGTCEWIVDTTADGVCAATTLMPTTAPTQACPDYFWIGGTQQKICSDHDRCRCYITGQYNKDCCLKDPQFEDGVYDKDRKHHEKDVCKLEVQYTAYSNRDKEWEGSSPGYLLTTQKHYFAIDIIPEDYECAMDIYWRFEWNNSSSLAEVGLEIDTQSGWLYPWNARDEARLTVAFTVSQLETRNPEPVYGRMVIVNATSQCRPDCYDGRIYPMEIPVWRDAYVDYGDPPTPPIRIQEKGSPSWIWWIVSALVVFFWILALLLYTYWWKTRDSCALEDPQNDFDEALYEEEVERSDHDGVEGIQKDSKEAKHNLHLF